MLKPSEVAVAIPPEPLSGLGDPTCVPAEQRPVAIGPQTKKVTLPVGVLVAAVPVIVAVSVTIVPGVTVPPAPVDGVVDICALQTPKPPPTKSLSVASTDCEERVSDRKLEKHSSPRPRKLRSTPPS